MFVPWDPIFEFIQTVYLTTHAGVKPPPNQPVASIIQSVWTTYAGQISIFTTEKFASKYDHNPQHRELPSRGFAQVHATEYAF